MYALIVYRPLLKLWKKKTILTTKPLYVNRKGLLLEVLYRSKKDKLIKIKEKCFIVKLICEDDKYDRMNTMRW